MDTFIDKLAQKRNAQEMILANMTAEAAKMEQMQNQMKAYEELMQNQMKAYEELTHNQMRAHEELMQEVRRVTLLTEENLTEVQDTLQDTLDEYMDKLDDIQENYSKDDETKQTLEQLKELLENNSNNEETIRVLTQLQELQEEKFRQSNDFLHKENVKVYRNVQAAVEEELNKQTEEFKKSQKENRSSKALLPISILILLAVLADIAVHLFSITIPL